MRYVVRRDFRGDFLWLLFTKADEVLALSSRSYPSHEACLAAIHEVKRSNLARIETEIAVEPQENGKP